MTHFVKKILRRKFLAGSIIIILVVGGYITYKVIAANNGVIRYVTAQAQKGTLVVSISGNGQVTVLNQIDLKPKVSGDVVSVEVSNNQEVMAGTIVVNLNAREAQKTVRDAIVNLESAKLSLKKLKEPADELEILQAQNSIAQAQDNLTKLKLTQEINLQKAQESKKKAEENLNKAYEDGFNSIASAFLDFPDIMTGLQDILYASTLGQGNQWNIDFYTNAVQSYDPVVLQLKDEVLSKYRQSRKSFDQNFLNYKSSSRSSDKESLETLIDETYETAKIIAETVKSINNLILFYQDELTKRNLKPQTLSDTHLTTLGTYTDKTNNRLVALLSIKQTIRDSKDAIVSAERDIKEMEQTYPLDLLAAQQSLKEREGSLLKLKAGPNALDIRSQELSVQQRANALLDAQEKLSDYIIHVPFDGLIAQLQVKKGDSVSSSTILGKLITKQKIAEISLNEVDVAKVTVGQKATLSFDAIPNFTITGQVIEVDFVGTVSQGVVTYVVKIAFDTQDERVKPSMSVSAAIVIEAKPDVLLIPNAAVKQQGNSSFVEISENPENPPRRQTIEVGISNDESTEILSGLQEGDVVVTRTIQPDSQQPQTQQQSGGLRIPGLPTGGMGGGGFRSGGGFNR